MPNEQQNFLDEFKKPEESNNPFSYMEESTPEKAPETPQEPEETPGDPEPRNRRERRLMEKLQSEREAAIALAAKLEVVTQSQKTRGEEAEFLTVAERIYGTQTPELREATELLKTALLGVKEEAKREALEAYQELYQKEQEAVKNAENRIDSMLEELEDQYNVDLVDGPHRTEFLKLLERMSPKDRNGNIVEYADHMAVWDVYQSQIKKPVNPAKEMAARAMTQSGAASQSSLNNEVNDRWARENGLL